MMSPLNIILSLSIFVIILLVFPVKASDRVVLETDLQFLSSKNIFFVDVKLFIEDVVSQSDLELYIFFDSTQLNLLKIDKVENDFNVIESMFSDSHNLDNDPTTEQYINISIKNISKVNNDMQALSSLFMRMSFEANEDFHGAFIHVSGQSSYGNQSLNTLTGHSVYIPKQN